MLVKQVRDPKAASRPVRLSLRAGSAPPRQGRAISRSPRRL